MDDPVAGLHEMARVTRPGGSVAACVWDFERDRAPISVFWRAARELNHGIEDESGFAGARPGHLAELLSTCGLEQIVEEELSISVDHDTFEEWWTPFTLGVGPAGAYVRELTEADRSAVRERCRALLPEGPFTIEATAWAARGIVASG
jgi:hypothetical protein